MSLVQKGCQLLAPKTVARGGDSHFHGGGDAVLGLAPGAGLEK